MRSHWRALTAASVVALCLAVLWAPTASAQAVTTGRISGTVVSDADGSPLPGAVVTAIHQPTATRYQTTTRDDGRFDLLNVRVGGPYLVTATMDGFVDTAKNQVFVALGEESNLEIAMPLQSVEDVLTVVGERSPIINPSRTGAATNVAVQNIETLPTVDRSLQDVAKMSPYFATFGNNGGATVVAVAGRNNRYNNIQIDGAVNNDVFGLADTGTPGGQAETQPIAYDAIQELQLLVSPYDVRQGGFTGGGINAITRSGSNSFRGSAYYFSRDQGLVGKGPLDREVGEFAQDEYGARVGGPILRDRAFFFVSGEINGLDRPTGYSADGSAPQQFINPDAAATLRDLLIDRYGYDPGSLSEVTRTTDSDKLFGRFDLNLLDNHQLVLRHNYVKANNDILFTGTTSWLYSKSGYHFKDKTNSTVAQLNSVLGSSLFNEARVTYQTIRDQRAGDDVFPNVYIRNLPGGGTLSAGTERYSTANSLDQDILELSDEVNWILGEHQISLGTANELFSFDNLFIRDNYGSYTFNSLADFEKGWAAAYDHSFSRTSDPRQSAKFDVQKLGFYGGDRWQVTPTLNLTYGLRLDVPYFPDSPSYNDAVDAAFGYRTDEVADGNMQWSPRLGFNWDVSGDGSQQLRGGIGYFAGRPPYVWISNQYGNSGVDFMRIGASLRGDITADNHIQFNPDPYSQYTDPAQLGGFAYTNEVNLIDPDFEYPQVMRASLGYDRQLDLLGLIGTAEVVWTQVQKDVLYQDLNTVPTGETTFGGRPTYERGNSSFGNVIFLTNTDKGDSLNATLKLERPFRNGWYLMGAYTYGDANDVNPGTSSQAVSNWRYLPVRTDPNHPDVARSDFEIEDRFIADVTYTFDWSEGWHTTASLFFNAQSGQPYSITYYNDVNGDGQYTNDLLYVPGSCDEVVFQDGDCSLFYAMTDAAGLPRGQIAERNASTAPWAHRLDLKLAQKIPVSRANVELTLDILNLANLFDRNAGVVRYVGFNNWSNAVRYQGTDEDTGKPIYQLLFTDPDQRFQIDDLRSRWQAKLGLRINF